MSNAGGRTNRNLQARVSNYIFHIHNPTRTGGCFPPGLRFFANNVGSNKGTQSKLGDFSYNLMPNKVKVTNFQN